LSFLDVFYYGRKEFFQLRVVFTEANQGLHLCGYLLFDEVIIITLIDATCDPYKRLSITAQCVDHGVYVGSF
jgi:hypothetical protein